VCAINSVTINSTGSVWGRRLTGCMQGRYTVAWQACRYLIDLSGFTNVGRWPKRAGCMQLPRANQATKSSFSGRNSLYT